MSPDEGRQEAKKGDAPDAPTDDQIPEVWRTELQRFQQEQQRRWNEYYQDQRSKSWWDKATTLGVWVYTFLTLAIVYFAGQQFLVAQDQERAQLRPYVVAQINTFSPAEDGKRLIPEPIDQNLSRLA